MQRLHVYRRSRVRPNLRTEDPGSPFQQLGFPGRDLVRMHVEMLGQLGKRLLASQGSQRWPAPIGWSGLNVSALSA